MKPNTLARIWREVKDVNADFFNLRTVLTPDEDAGDRLRFWFVMLPNDGAMAHLTLVGSLAVRSKYPEEPPIVKLYTPTKRYNVDVYRHVLTNNARQSSMCFSILRSEAEGGTWKPEYTLSCLFASLMSAIVSFYVTQEGGKVLPEYVSMERLYLVKQGAHQAYEQHKHHLPAVPRIPLVEATPIPAEPLFAPQTFTAGSPSTLTSSPIYLQTGSNTVYAFSVDLSNLNRDIVFSIILSNSTTDFLGKTPNTILIRNGVTATAARKLADQPTQWFYHGKPMNDGDMRLHVAIGRDQMTFAYHDEGRVVVHGDCPVSRLDEERIGNVKGVPFFVHVVTKDKYVGWPEWKGPVEIEVLDNRGIGYVHEGIGREEREDFGFELVEKEDGVVGGDGDVVEDASGVVGLFAGMGLK